MNPSDVILVLNCGSSSVKYQVRAVAAPRPLAAGLVERVGGEGLFRHQRAGEAAIEARVAAPDHGAALALILDRVAMESPHLAAVGHRVVHGGERFTAPVRVDAEVMAAIRDLSSLAPLHNPASLEGMTAFLERYPDLPQVAAFDTAFHATLPEMAWRYATPEAWYRRFGVRRYGFHGLSHAFVAGRAAAMLGKPPAELNLISLHLGNGASVAAVRGGRCVDTSMGMTPMEGLVMGERCGDLDPAVPLYMARTAGLSVAAIDAALNRDSGLKGLCGDADMRAVLARRQSGDAAARLAFAVYVQRIRKYIGAYHAVLGRVDALAFTAGVGERAPEVRAAVCAGLEGLGWRLDAKKNGAALGVEAAIQEEDAPQAILVTPTDEEGEIARQTAACLGWIESPARHVGGLG